MAKTRSIALRCFFFSVFYIIYLCIGATVFSTIEEPHEDNLKDDIRQLTQDFLDENSCVNLGSLESLIEEVIVANDYGISWKLNGTKYTNWDFWSSLFFSTTLLTTIGYGHASPLSTSGKAFCVVYITIGVPVTLLFLGRLMALLGKCSDKLLRYLRNKLNYKVAKLSINLLHLSILVLTILAFMVFIPAAVFTVLEPKWRYFDSFYFIFISTTTVGLGDFVPGQQAEQFGWTRLSRNIYLVLVSVYLLFAISSLLLIIDTAVRIPEVSLVLSSITHDVRYGTSHDENTDLMSSASAESYTSISSTANLVAADTSKSKKDNITD
ncbi:potassium channel subfamily K member 1-like [Antedon mediterranea]|uniref:potassium channel subfamily K member 1-like n=1 Tax=Antedon mediterranea TaxID=105859 RepID=UPI003AF7CB11